MYCDSYANVCKDDTSSCPARILSWSVKGPARFRGFTFLFPSRKIVNFHSLEYCLKVGVVVLPIESSGHNHISIITFQHSRNIGYNLFNLCVKKVLTVEAIKCKSLVSVIAPPSIENSMIRWDVHQQKTGGNRGWGRFYWIFCILWTFEWNFWLLKLALDESASLICLPIVDPSSYDQCLWVALPMVSTMYGFMFWHSLDYVVFFKFC